MSINEFDDKIVGIEKNFRIASWMVKKKGREILGDFDITPPQFTALYMLSGEINLTIGELSNKMYLACSTVTDLLDRMERNGLVVRVKDEKDRRVVRIKVLDKGEEMIQDVLKTRRNYIAGILEGVSEEMVESVYEVMEMLCEKMDIEKC